MRVDLGRSGAPRRLTDQGAGRADEPREEVRAAQPGKDAELRERQPELGARGCDADIAGQGHRHPDADRGAVDCDAHRLRELHQLEWKLLQERLFTELRSL